MSDENNQNCQRCGNRPDPDLRTLWMACFYQMDELDVPFDPKAIFGQVRLKVGEENYKSEFMREKTFPVWGELLGEERDHSFFTLKVCKDCRAEWMAAIEKWFNSFVPKESPGTGIYIRDKGASIEVTEEEFWEREAVRDANDVIKEDKDVIDEAKDFLDK